MCESKDTKISWEALADPSLSGSIDIQKTHQIVATSGCV